jgi:hypothetical protein
MILKILAMCAILLALPQVPTDTPTVKPSAAQPATPRPRQLGSTPAASISQPAAVRPSAAPQTSGRPVSAPDASAAPADCNGFPCDEQQQRPMIVTMPVPPPSPWLWRERLAWGANIVLALLGYVGIMMALSVLKKIERQTRSAETVAAAAAVSAQAALLNAQAIIDAERPWLLISVEPSLGQENSFIVMVTNRGRSPASIAGTSEQFRIAVDETHLPASPEYANAQPTPPLLPIILLPGETSGIKTFSRDEARGVCQSDEQFKKIEGWDEKIYLFGKITYRDLIAPPDKQTHETNWCCWYIHGRQKSGLVIAGPQGYNSHT